MFLATVIFIIGLQGLMFRDMQATMLAADYGLDLFFVSFLSE